MEYNTAIGAALMWAASAPIVNRGVAKLPPELGLVGGVMVGLLISLATGVFSLGLFVFADAGEMPSATPSLVAAGLLTFPIGTGLYYFCGKALRSRLELAAQSANVKPILSIFLGTVVLHEEVESMTLVAVALIVIGAAVLTIGSKRIRFSALALSLGLATAAAWAFGEVFMKIAIQGPTSINDTFAAQVYGASAFAIGMILFGRPALASAFRHVEAGWVVPFVLHGLLSFGLGYTLYFEAIRTTGLVSTVVVTAFWPGLALVLQQALGAATGTREPYGVTVWVGSGLLTAGALVKLLGSGAG